MDVKTKGSLSETGFIKIMLSVHTSGITGMIRTEKGSVIKVVYVHGGTISFASSNEPSDKLTEVLKRAGKLTSELVEDAIARLKPNVSLGKTLVELGYISARDLLWGARAQVEGILHQLLFWNEGNYQIIIGNLPKEIIHLNLSVPMVIFDGIKKSQDRQWVLDYIGSPEAVYRIHPQFVEQNQIWKLPVDEIVAHMNGRRNLLEIAHVSGMDTFEVCKSVVGLEVLGCAKRSVPAPVQMTLEVPAEQAEKEISEDPGDPAPDHGEPDEVSVPKPPEEPEDSKEDEELALGQVVQIPTVEELLDRTARETPREERVGLPPVEPADQRVAPQESIPQPAVTEGSESSEVPLRNDRRSMEALTLLEESPPSRWKYYVPIIAIFAILSAASYFYFLAPERDVPDFPIESGSSDFARPLSDRIQEQAGISDETPQAESTTGPESSSEISDVPAVEDRPAPTQLLQKGNFTAAAQMWRSELLLEKPLVTIQLMIACENKSVEEAFQLLEYSTEAFIVPMKFKGRDCYRVLFGLYPSNSDAQSAITSLPAAFLVQASPPAVVPVSRVLQ